MKEQIAEIIKGTDVFDSLSDGNKLQLFGNIIKHVENPKHILPTIDNITTWQVECDTSKPYTVMSVQIGFSHKENDDDEVEFSINAWRSAELEELFQDFIDENHFEDITVTSISVVRVAKNMDKLILEES